MYSCCVEPLDLRIESKKIESDVACLQRYYNDYDSSCAEHGGVHGGAAEYGGFPHSYYHRYMRNDGNAEAALPMHQQMVEKYDYPHPSPMSDEGFVDGTNITEENLPDFAKIQHLPVESDRQPVRRRSSSSSPKVKKVPRDLQPVAEKERRKPGRKPGQVSNVLHLWEFMRDLLQSPDNPGIIEWISKADGVFRVVNSTEVARLWGEKKKNKKKMTYEKLSRSLRYSRLEGYFSDLPKDKNYPKKLCFKFGPKSKDWH